MDNQLILIIGNLEISWFAVFTAAACAAGVCMACLLRFLQRKDVNDIFTCVAFGIPLGVIFGRILYIVFSGSGLTGLGQFINVTNGGFGLYGVILGVFAGAVIAVRFFDADGLGSLLDCLSIGGAFAITVGRFATGFTPAEIGYEVDFRLFAVYDSEQGIYNLAIYKLDGIYEAVIFAICLWFFIRCLKIGNRDCIFGKTALLMLALHGTNQVVMDSMRADPLKLGMNEFIKISQIIGILCCVAALVYFIIVTARRNGFGRFHWISLPLIVVSIVLGVFGEYRVGSSNYISNHLIMFAGMVILDWLTIEFAIEAAGSSEKCIPASVPAKAEDDEDAEAKPTAEKAVKTAAPASAEVPAANAAPVKKNAPSPVPAAPAENGGKTRNVAVVSVDSRQSAAKSKKVKVVSVQTAGNAASEPAAKTASVGAAKGAADKPLGKQELNMDLLVQELDKIDK